MIAPRQNPDWYRLKYNLAALHANRAADRLHSHETPTELIQQDLGEARTLARELAVAAMSTPTSDKALEEFLKNTVETATLVLLAGVIDWRPTTARGETRTPTAPERKELLASLSDPKPHLDPILAPRIVAYVEQQPIVDSRTLYNLACLYTGWQMYPLAVERLLRSISSAPSQSRGHLAAMALRDPSLEPLLQEMGRVDDLRDRLEALVPEGPGAVPFWRRFFD